MEFDKNVETGISLFNSNVGRTTVSLTWDLTSKYVRNGNRPEIFISNPHK
jgi:hypothetical protein